MKRNELIKEVERQSKINKSEVTSLGPGDVVLKGETLLAILHASFISKFSLDELVAFDDKRDDGDRSYGFVRAISFWKSDAVNYAVSYDIEELNTKNQRKSVPESAMQRGFA